MRRSLIPIFNELEDIKDFFSAFDSTLPNISREELSGISLYEDENKLYIEAAVPGIRPEDLCVTFDKGILWIKGENKQEEKKVKYYIKAHASFSYRIPISNKIDEQAIPDAVCKDGIVTIIFSKSKGTMAKKIEVKAK